ncbi:hypothetical protein LguiA_027948 [Lonicera macranthoides]
MYPNSESITSSLFHFPSPNYNLQYEYDSVFLQHFPEVFSTNEINNDDMPNQNQTQTDQTTNNKKQADSNTSTTVVHTLVKQVAHQSTPKKRSSKKDRHSKINTAHGPRDRRMRLSLDVARKFFGLQDMLRFDKASKTVEWLLTKSKSAIKDLTRGLNSNHSSSVGANSSSSTSECEVLSGTEDTRVLNEDTYHVSNTNTSTKGKATVGKAKKSKGVVTRRIAFDANARELREKARERARERTKKRKLQGKELNSSQLGCWSPARGESGTQNGSLDEQLAEVDEPSSGERQQVNDDQGSSRDQDMIFVSIRGVSGLWQTMGGLQQLNNIL